MARAVLIILSTVIITFGIYSLVVNRSIIHSTENMSDYYRDVMVRNITNSMMEIIQRKLIDSTSYRVPNWNSSILIGGTTKYRVIDTMVNGESLVKVNVIGNFEGKRKSIEAIYKIVQSQNDSLPQIFKYAILSGKSFSLNGNVTITNAGNGLNANVHTNENFSMNGNNRIEGFVTYNGSFSANPPGAVNRSIVPVSNPEGLPVHYKTASIPIPDFEPSQFKRIATEIYYGDKIFNGNITLGTKDNPKIIYVKGNLILNGKIDGYGIFISEERTIINGNVTISNPNNVNNNVGIFSGDKLIVNGNIKIEAQIFSNKDITLNGNISIKGSVISKEKVIFNGNPKLYYKPINSELSKYIFNPSLTENTSLQMIYYYE